MDSRVHSPTRQCLENIAESRENALDVAVFAGSCSVQAEANSRADGVLERVQG